MFEMRQHDGTFKSEDILEMNMMPHCNQAPPNSALSIEVSDRNG